MNAIFFSFKKEKSKLSSHFIFYPILYDVYVCIQMNTVRKCMEKSDSVLQMPSKCKWTNVVLSVREQITAAVGYSVYIVYLGLLPGFGT